MKKHLLAFSFILPTVCGFSQTYPVGCPALTDSKTGQSASNCSPIASNFTGTWANLPAGSVTGFFKFTYANYANAATTLLPYAITRVVLTTTSSALVTNPVFGPASKVGNTPSNSTSGDVFYCYYGLNGDVMPAAGTMSIEFKQPIAGSTTAYICSYDLASRASTSTPSAVSGVLPVSFAGVSAKEGRSGVDLFWTMERESNIKGYHIQRSNDAMNYTDVAFVGAQSIGGNSDVRRSYSFSDKNLSAGQPSLYYRIRQEDINGTNAYSRVVKISLSRLAYGFTVMADPGKITLRKKAGVPPGNYAVSLIGADGTRRATKNFNNADVVTFDNLSNGLFYLQLVSNKGEVRTFAVKAQ